MNFLENSSSSDSLRPVTAIASPSREGNSDSVTLFAYNPNSIVSLKDICGIVYDCERFVDHSTSTGEYSLVDSLVLMPDYILNSCYANKSRLLIRIIDAIPIIDLKSMTFTKGIKSRLSLTFKNGRCLEYILDGASNCANEIKYRMKVLGKSGKVSRTCPHSEEEKVSSMFEKWNNNKYPLSDASIDDAMEILRMAGELYATYGSTTLTTYITAVKQFLGASDVLEYLDNKRENDPSDDLRFLEGTDDEVIPRKDPNRIGDDKVFLNTENTADLKNEPQKPVEVNSYRINNDFMDINLSDDETHPKFETHEILGSNPALAPTSIALNSTSTSISTPTPTPTFTQIDPSSALFDLDKLLSVQNLAHASPPTKSYDEDQDDPFFSDLNHELNDLMSTYLTPNSKLENLDSFSMDEMEKIFGGKSFMDDDS